MHRITDLGKHKIDYSRNPRKTQQVVGLCFISAVVVGRQMRRAAPFLRNAHEPELWVYSACCLARNIRRANATIDS